MNSFKNINHTRGRDSKQELYEKKIFYPRYNSKFLWLFFSLIVLLGLNIQAQDEIQVGGTLTENEIWTKEHTYIVYKDLRIPDTVTLIIQAGVTVKVDQGRGIFVLGGNLFVAGQKNDSVRFLANYSRDQQEWKWKGINYTGVDGVGENSISYTKIIDAEIAVDSYNSNEILIGDVLISNSQNIGVRFFNSRNCQILNSNLYGNYDGVEIIATDGEEASKNKIAGCRLKNENHNIYLLKAYGGRLVSNLIENNLVEDANNGIWLDNGGGEAFGRNMIRKNIIINNGADAGFGILIAQDSIDVEHNIFWKNHIAVFYDQATVGNMLMYNSFYQNNEGISLSANAVENKIRHNTFSMNTNRIIEISETRGTVWQQNNIFNMPGSEKMITNLTADNLEITNNFWYHSGEQEIQKLIWDKQDDPALGELFFMPYLPEADTVAPVAPPMNLIKQQVNGKVKVSWNPNPEKDIYGYNIYYGPFRNYSFPFSVSLGKDTAFFLTDTDISDTIVVTSLDSALLAQEAQVLGHESPFAFAEIWPYAGADNKICKMHLRFPLQEATIPYVYDSVFWSTNGDGTFNDEHLLHAVYYTGPGDRENGRVVLTIAVTSFGVVKKDSLVLYIFDNPEVFAGNDTTLLADEHLLLSSSNAFYYEKVVWSSTGDGTFDNDTVMHPVYAPGEEDLTAGMVNLVLTAISDCGSSADTMTVTWEPIYTVEGNVWYEGAPANHAVVLAMKNDPEGVRAINLARTETDGSFLLSRLTEGNYMLYAVPDTLSAGIAVPGYYANKLRWQNAWNFNIDANTYDVDIMLPSVDYILPEGEASISGYFVMPGAGMFAEDIYCNSWFDPGSVLTYCDGGLSNITVFLYNSTAVKLLDYTLTDENGNFHFSNLPYGNYIVDAEKAGYETSVSSLITLSPDHPEETNVMIELNENKKIGIYRESGHLSANRLKVYPNPADRYVYLSATAPQKEPLEVVVYNLLGRPVLQQIIKNNSSEQVYVKLDVSRLNSGMYIGQMRSRNLISGFSFIKK